jgi:hypothetical protein
LKVIVDEVTERINLSQYRVFNGRFRLCGDMLILVIAGEECKDYKGKR